MKKYISVLLITSAFLFSACEKKVEDVGEFNVTVEYKSSNPKAITGDITVNAKDSIYLDFSISSPSADMSYVEIQKNGVRIDTFRMSAFTDKRNFSLLKGYRADSIPGDYSYRVLARDARAVFMGDGGKLIKVTVTPNYTYWAQRILVVPDTTAKTNPCYFATTNGQNYSYTSAASVSNLIDFGYYFDTTKVNAGSPATLQPRGHTIYALTNTVAPFTPYDISSWTKNATIFKASTANFTTTNSAGAIRTAAVAALTSGTVTRFSQTDRAAAQISNKLTGQVLVFKTATGKYGMLNVYYTNDNGALNNTANVSFISIEVKIEK